MSDRKVTVRKLHSSLHTETGGYDTVIKEVSGPYREELIINAHSFARTSCKPQNILTRSTP